MDNELNFDAAFDLEYSLGYMIDECLRQKMRSDYYDQRAAELREKRERLRSKRLNNPFPSAPVMHEQVFSAVFAWQPLKAIHIAVYEQRAISARVDMEALLHDWEATHTAESITQWEAKNGPS